MATPRYLTIEEVAAMLGKPGRPASRNRVYEWVKTGISAGRKQPKVKLRATRIPSGMVFTQADVDVFVAQLSGHLPPHFVEPPLDLSTLSKDYPRPARLPRPGRRDPLSPAAPGVRTCLTTAAARTRAG